MTTANSERITQSSNPLRYYRLETMPRELWSVLAQLFRDSISNVTRSGFTIAIPARAHNEVSLLKQCIQSWDDYPCIVGVSNHPPEEAE